MCIFFKININSSIFFENTHFLGTNLKSLIVCCLSSGDMYLFLWVVNSTSSSSSLLLLLLMLLFDGFLETLVILSAILLPVKSPVASAVLWVALLDAVFIESVVDFLALLRSFWAILVARVAAYLLLEYLISIR